MTDIDLKRILDSKDNIYANLTTKKLALMTDDDLCLVANNGGTFQKYLFYETSDGVTETSVETGTKIFTSTATTGLLNSQLDNALSEINTNKMEVNNGQGVGLTELVELEVDTTVTVDIARIWESATRIGYASFGHDSAVGSVGNEGFIQDSTGHVELCSRDEITMRTNFGSVLFMDTTQARFGSSGNTAQLTVELGREVTANSAYYNYYIDNTNQGVVFNSVYNSGAPTVPYEWKVNGNSIFQILEDGFVASRSGDVNCTIESDEDVLFWLRSDMNNVTETDNPIFRMTQDGDGVTTDLGLVGNGTEYVGAAGNNAYWLTDTFAIDLAPAGNREVRIASTGTTFSNSTIDLNGLIVKGSLASAPSSPIAGWCYYDTTTNKHRGYDGTTWNDFY